MVVLFAEAVRSVAAREQKRHPSPYQFIGNRVGFYSVKIDVEHSDINHTLIDKLQRVLKPVGRTDHRTAQVRKQILDQHRNQRLVLDNEYA